MIWQSFSGCFLLLKPHADREWNKLPFHLKEEYLSIQEDCVLLQILMVVCACLMTRTKADRLEKRSCSTDGEQVFACLHLNLGDRVTHVYVHFRLKFHVKWGMFMTWSALSLPRIRRRKRVWKPIAAEVGAGRLLLMRFIHRIQLIRSRVIVNY